MTTLRTLITAIAIAVATPACTVGKHDDSNHPIDSASLKGLWELDAPEPGHPESRPGPSRPYLYFGDDGFARIDSSGVSAKPIPWSLLDRTRLRVNFRGGGETEVALITGTQAQITVQWSGGDTSSYSFVSRFNSKNGAVGRIREVNPPPAFDPRMLSTADLQAYWHSRIEHGYWTQISPPRAPDGLFIQELRLHESGFTVTASP
ncbi:MAG: hypothetical protein ACR2RV_27210, partial [Verrucomicrobiales bacterium]